MLGSSMGFASSASSCASLMRSLSQARRCSDDLFDIVRPEAFYERPIPERNRIIFYLGHLEAFDWNLFGRELPGLRSFAPNFDKLFAFGIDPVNGNLPDDQPGDWPGRDEVNQYNQRVRAAIDDELSAAADGVASERDRTLRQFMHVAIEHRLMHVETLAYMLHQLPLNLKCVCTTLPAPRAPQVRPQMTTIPAGSVTLGLKRNGKFGWDNEFEEHTAFVPAFRIDNYKVTNAQYLRFVAEGGYSEKSFWSDAAWDWLRSTGTQHPVFWKRQGNQFFFRTMFDEVPLPLDWPVYVSHAEALAYARWARKELPTEAEWHRAAYGTYTGAEREYPWGDASPAAGFGNFDLQYWDPTPVAAFPAGSSAFGVADMVGNGWEWTRTVFAPFDGFTPFPFYPGYSANFFDNHHFVMKGGSARTSACMLRRSFRNWFQPHYSYVYAGFRSVEH